VITDAKGIDYALNRNSIGKAGPTTASPGVPLSTDGAPMIGAYGFAPVLIQFSINVMLADESGDLPLGI
jgi:hypothetical protein